MYRSTMGLDRSGGNNITYQNCEIAWIGGGSHIIGMGAPSNEAGLSPFGTPIVPASGEGIRLEGNNNKAIHNYVHDCFDGGITVEFDAAWSDWYVQGMIIQDNLIERCVSGILVGEHNEDLSKADNIRFSGIEITGNYILFSGYGWSSAANYDTWIGSDYDGNAISWWDGPLWNNGGTVRDNILYVAKNALIRHGAEGENKPVLSGNTYAQNNNGIIAYVKNEENQPQMFHALDDGMAMAVVVNILGDEAGEILPLSLPPIDSTSLP